ncbi:MAG: tetratricopeptide repeat protein [Candidatus Hodarchaeota archaeon]
MGLGRVFDLFDKGKFEECIVAVEALHGEEKLQGEFIRIFALLEGTGDIRQALAVSNQLMELGQESIKRQIISLITKSVVLWWQARYREAIREIETAEHLISQMNKKDRNEFQFIEGAMKYAQATFYHGIGKLDHALAILNKGIKIVEKPPFPWKSLVSYYYSGIGNVYEEKGEFNKALDSYLISLAKSKESLHIQSFIPNYVSNIYHILGDLDLSLEYAQRALKISRKIGLNRAIFRSLLNIGSINQSKGELQLAIKNFQECLSLTKEIGYDHFIALSYYKLIGVLLQERDSQERISYYIDQLLKIAKKTQSYDVKIQAKLAEAMVLKQSNRFQDKGHAQDIFRQIVDEKNASQNYRILAVLNLSELLLVELKVFGEEEIYNEILQSLEYLSDLAKELNSNSLKIETLILQSKFALIEGSAEKANTLLETADNIAKEKELKQLDQKVNREQKVLNKELNKWIELAERNAPLIERIEHSQLKEYINEAIKLRELTKDRSYMR